MAYKDFPILLNNMLLDLYILLYPKKKRCNIVCLITGLAWSRVLRAVVLHVPCALRVVVSYVLRALRDLVPHMSCALRAYVPHVPHVPRALHALVPHVCHALGVLITHVLRVLHALVPEVPCTSFWNETPLSLKYR